MSERLGRYRIGERIGQGGAGEVFRAQMEGAGGFSKAVAIKRVRRRLVRDRKVVDDFVREAEIAKLLQHGNIVQIFDVGLEDGLPYLVMEYVDGVSLAELIEAGALPADEAVYVVEQVAAALEYAHGLADEHGRPAGVIHRDIKPRNILLSRDGVVKLTDFGIARPLYAPARTTPGMIKGSLWYMSPEQLHGERIDERTDQFAAGVVLHEMLAGVNPLAAADGVVQYAELLDRGLPTLEAPVDGELAAITARATRPTPDARYPSMADFRAALETWRVQRGIRSSPEGVRRRVRAVLGMADTPATADLGVALADRLGPLATGPTLAAPAPAPHTPRGAPWKRIAFASVGVVAAAAVAVAVRSAVGVSGTRTVVAGAGSVADARAPASERDAPPIAPGERGESDTAAARDARAASRQTDAPSDAGAGGAGDAASMGSGSRSAAGEPRATRARARRRGDRARHDREPRARSAEPSTTPVAPGRVKINLIPYAVVTVDGRAAGRTPVDLSLPPGRHHVALDNPDTGQRKALELTVQSGDTTTITNW